MSPASTDNLDIPGRVTGSCASQQCQSRSSSARSSHPRPLSRRAKSLERAHAHARGAAVYPSAALLAPLPLPDDLGSEGRRELLFGNLLCCPRSRAAVIRLRAVAFRSLPSRPATSPEAPRRPLAAAPHVRLPAGSRASPAAPEVARDYFACLSRGRPRFARRKERAA